MKENIYSYINPGLIHCMAYPDTISGKGRILETLKKVTEDDFFMAVEIAWIKEDIVREKVKQLLKQSHLDVYYAAHIRLLSEELDLNSVDKKMRDNAVMALKRGVDEALELNSKAIAFLSGKNVEDEKKEEAINNLVDSIKQVCEYAQSKKEDFKVVLEIFDYDIDKCSLVGPTNIAKKVAEKVCEKYNNFGLMVDLSHLPMLGETPEESIKPILDYLVHIHIGNTVIDEQHPAYGDSHPRFGFEAGENDIDELVEFLRVLIETGYLDGKDAKTVSFEVKPWEDESPEIVIANAKRVLKKAWAKL